MWLVKYECNDVGIADGQVYSDSTGNAQDYGNQERTFSDEGTDGSNIGLHDGTQPDPGNSNSNPTSTNNDGSNNGENSIDTTNLGGNSNGNANQNITNLASNINSNANQYNAGTSEGCRFNGTP